MQEQWQMRLDNEIELRKAVEGDLKEVREQAFRLKQILAKQESKGRKQAEMFADMQR